MKPPSFEVRFWRRVEKSEGGCWNWIGGKDSDGYGAIWFRGTMDRAHRVSWEMANGRSPGKLMVLHRCDNPACVNPEHLFTGTARDNAADCVSKGRNWNPPGEFHPRAKLKNEQADEIRFLRRSGISCGALARHYGLHRTTITRITQRITYKHHANVNLPAI